MLSFTDVVETIKTNMCVEPIKAKLFQITNHHKLLITEPINKLDTYQDIIAQIILYQDDIVIENKLITYDTDLEYVIRKIKKKIETSENQKKGFD
jgi:hypothetical protein